MENFSNGAPIFDSLTHPSFSGNWIGKTMFSDSKFSTLIASMADNNIEAAVACNYTLNENIPIKDFVHNCIINSNKLKLYPCLIIDQSVINNPDIFIENIITIIPIEFPIIIKINASYTSFADYKNIIKCIHSIYKIIGKKLILYICTYPFQCSPTMRRENVFKLIDELIISNPDYKIILLHGGTVDILRYSQYAQHFNNIYLDLSFTLCRYIDSSLLYDFVYLFSQLDKKLVIGSDHPEYDYLYLRKVLSIIEMRLLRTMKNDLVIQKMSNVMISNMENIIRF
ncbi:hypothetical protein [Prochlorococcus marinus]|uniref:hypothetical protein n=1 Tax=Prochlorococcus marinus TaxID=1219 RepID=UPI0022B5B98E|nr:hypothetical protein [Prochlorococcus marinus]